MWVDQSHGVLQVEVRLAVVLEPLGDGLIDTAIDGVENGRMANEGLRKVGEKKVQITLEIGLRSVFDNAIAILWVGAETGAKLVKSS